MTDTDKPKRRGRPATGAALSSTERSRRLHEKAERVYERAFHPGRPLADIADSALLIAFTREYRECRRARISENERLAVRFARELLLRLGVESTALASLEAHYSIESPATESVEPTDNQTDSMAVETTDIPAPFTLSPAAPTEPVSLRHDPQARDARILALAPLPWVKTAEIINAEGIKCSARTVGYVRKAMKRRHLNESQRAMVAAKLANVTKADAGRMGADASHGLATANLQLPKTTTVEAAEMLAVSPRSVATAKKIQETALLAG